MNEIRFKINGRNVSGTAEDTILSVAKRCEIDIPTLCHLETVEPAGACRVCMVEVTHPSWNGWSNLVTACVYPVAEGIEITTNSERVKAARKTILDMLLARCPESNELRAFAKKYSKLESSSLMPRKDADNCILCTLCTRVCDEHSTAAISTFSRGTSKEVGVPLGTAEDCVGCGACSLVCPTNHIQFTHEKGRWEIWNRKFKPALAAVNADKCRACGRCEEVCPFHIPQVTLKTDGFPVSYISEDYCQGCGLCVASCPTGAIDQEQFSEASVYNQIARLAESGTVVFACPRSPFHNDLKHKVIILPCIGRVSLAMLMFAANSGAEKVFLMGRSQETCYFSNGETYAKFTIDYAKQLLKLAGINNVSIEFVLPEKGQEGPDDFIDNLPTTKQQSVSVFEELKPNAGYQAIKNFIYEHYSSVNPDLSCWIGNAAKTKSGTAIFVGCAPILDTISGYINGKNEIAELVSQAIALLKANGETVQVIGGTYCHHDQAKIDLLKAELKEKGINKILFLAPCSQKNFASKLDPSISLHSLVEVLANYIDPEKPVDELTVFGKPCFDLPAELPIKFVTEPAIDYQQIPAEFVIEHSDWQSAVNVFARADELSAEAVLFNCAMRYLYSKLFVRDGAWRTVRSEPILALELVLRACASFQKEPLDCGCESLSE